jgi:hypothetical protein
MEGAHDMGGLAWSDPVRPEPNEPVFHAEWERRAFAITLAMGMPGGWNIDMSRFAREDRPPEDYLAKSYYQIWLAGLERLALERGLVAPDEIEAGKQLHPAKPVARILAPDGVAAMLHRGGPTAMPRALLASRLAIAFAPSSSIRRPIRDCRATCAVMPASSNVCWAVMSFPTAMRPARVKIRSGSTPSPSMAASCGARLRIPA